MNSNLDIWVIQYYSEELINAMNNIKDGLNIIYSNVKSNLNIGDSKITSRQFDTILYNEESDILIILMRDGIVNKEDMIKYLNENNKRYVEINFDYEINYKEKDNVPELWFSREKYVLEEALKDSLNRGIDTCKYYPFVKSNLELGFFTKYRKYINLDNVNFRGLIKLDDKIVLIVNQKNNIDELGNDRNLGVFDMLEITDNLNMNIRMIYDKEPKILEEEFFKKLSLRKKDY